MGSAPRATGCPDPRRPRHRQALARPLRTRKETRILRSSLHPLRFPKAPHDPIRSPGSRRVPLAPTRRVRFARLPLTATKMTSKSSGPPAPPPRSPEKMASFLPLNRWASRLRPTKWLRFCRFALTPACRLPPRLRRLRLLRSPMISLRLPPQARGEPPQPRRYCGTAGGGRGWRWLGRKRGTTERGRGAGSAD